jgi:hypothetical protein
VLEAGCRAFAQDRNRRRRRRLRCGSPTGSRHNKERIFSAPVLPAIAARHAFRPATTATFRRPRGAAPNRSDATPSGTERLDYASQPQGVAELLSNAPPLEPLQAGFMISFSPRHQASLRRYQPALHQPARIRYKRVQTTRDCRTQRRVLSRRRWTDRRAFLRSKVG